MSLGNSHVATLSVRLLWPFARLYGADPRAAEYIESSGVPLSDFANPETRLPHSAAMRALELVVSVLGDPLIGLRAGEQVDHAELEVVEYAARSATNFGDAMRLMARYLHILHDGVEATLSVEGDRAFWRIRILDGVRQPPAANDFLIASALAFSRRNVANYEHPLEIRMMHEKPAYAAEVERAFETEVHFGAPYNTIVIRRDRLDAPMLRPSPSMSAVFEQQAQRALQKMRDAQGLVGRVRVEVAQQLCAGSVSMRATSRRVGLGVATLRRRLQEQGTTFSEIVDNLRRQLAEEHLSGAAPTVSEVAFQLGFSNVRAFGRAFRRWTGKTPTEYRSGNGH